MNGLKVFGAVVILTCMTTSAKVKKALVPTYADRSVDRSSVAMRITNGTTLRPETDRCIVLIGGNLLTGAPLVEYYHPTAACNITHISTERLEESWTWTSGCFLPDTQQIVIRDSLNPDVPSILYPLSGGAAKAVAMPYSGRGRGYTAGNTSAMVGGRCVSCGGWETADSMIQCYSLSTTHWTSLPSMPNALAHSASVALGADYYIIGGRNSTADHSNQMYHYNTISNEWHTDTPMDEALCWHSAAALSDDKLIVCGGWKPYGQRPRRDCTMYSATTRRWTRAGDLYHGRAGFVMVVFSGRVYAMGGNWHNTLDTAEVYDRAADSWTVVDNKLKGGRFQFVGVVV